MPVHDNTMEAEVRPLLEYAHKKLGEWVEFKVLDDRGLNSTVRWFVYGKTSPFGWSPQGRVQTATYSYDLMWETPNGEWTREIRDTGKYDGGLRIGRLKLRIKKRRSSNG